MSIRSKVVAAALSLSVGMVGVVGNCATINGAGASFPAPVYRAWTYTYKSVAKDTVNYQSVGSGAGIKQIKAKTVDFGASDKPLKSDELKESGLLQFPMLMGGVVPIVNVPGIKSNELTLSGAVLADIFLGNIKKWNDPAIKRLNSNVALPDMPITVVHRSDGSGTTWIFTNYLTKVSPAWKDGPGNGKAVAWPVGLGGQKNPGVANNVKRSSGSIGYVEYTYAVESKLATVKMINKSGATVEPSLASFQAAGANANWSEAPGFYMVLTDQPGDDSWPITGVTYILVHKEQKDFNQANAMLRYFAWCYRKGAEMAKKMQYAPMPPKVTALIYDAWGGIIADNKPVWNN